MNSAYLNKIILLGDLLNTEVTPIGFQYNVLYYAFSTGSIFTIVSLAIKQCAVCNFGMYCTTNTDSFVILQKIPVIGSNFMSTKVLLFLILFFLITPPKGCITAKECSNILSRVLINLLN